MTNKTKNLAAALPKKCGWFSSDEEKNRYCDDEKASGPELRVGGGDCSD